MRRMMGVILGLLLTTLPTQAVEPIKCAFGLCLGEPFKPAAGEKFEQYASESRGLPKNSQIGSWGWIHPPEPDPAFRTYHVSAFPLDPRIVEISAVSAPFSTSGECIDAAAHLQRQLTDQYGEASVKRLDGGTFFAYFPTAGRYIHVGCMNLNLYLTYADADLKEQGEAPGKIKCAFGLCLGDVYTGRFKFWGRYADWIVDEGEISPPIPNSLFPEYRLKITPLSRRIFSITGQSRRAENMGSCKRRLSDVLEILQHKYGQFRLEKDGTLFGFGFFSWYKPQDLGTRDLREISLICNCLVEICFMTLEYRHRWLAGEAGQEREKKLSEDRKKGL